MTTFVLCFSLVDDRKQAQLPSVGGMMDQIEPQQFAIVPEETCFPRFDTPSRNTIECASAPQLSERSSHEYA